MEDNMVPLAFYVNIPDANRHADLLKAEGIRCKIEVNPHSGDGLYRDREGDIVLLVHEYDFDRADLILEMDDRTFDDSERREKPGEKNMLAGGVISLTGMLAALGNLDGLPDNMMLIPYAVAAIGGVIFFRGMLESRSEEQTDQF